jgi:hypothetical protein
VKVFLQGARLLVIAPALLHADAFGRRDLNVIDVPAVPDRLEHPVAEPKHQDVLHGFFAQVMVDPVDLLFAQHLRDLRIQRACKA